MLVKLLINHIGTVEANCYIHVKKSPLIPIILDSLKQKELA